MAFKDKIITFFKRVANTIPTIKDFINNEAQEIKEDIFRRNDVGMGMG